MRNVIILSILIWCTSIQCTRPDALGESAIEALRKQDIPKAFELSLKAMDDGSSNQLVCYLAAMGKFYEGDLVSCMSYASRIHEGDSMYSRARVIYTSAWVQENPTKMIPSGLIDSLERQIKVATDNQNLSVLHEARQLVYQRLWQFAYDKGDSLAPRYGMEMMGSAISGVMHDSVSLPSWKILVERRLLRGVVSVTNLLYRTAANIAGDERLIREQKLGIVYLAMQQAAENQDLDLLRRFAAIYVQLDPIGTNSGFSSIALLSDNVAPERYQELLRETALRDSVLQETLFQSTYPRILIPSLAATQKTNA
jgi:hypothetical protein